MPDISSHIAKFDKELRGRERELVKDVIGKFRSAYKDTSADLLSVLAKADKARREGQTVNKEWLVRETQLRNVLKKLEGEMRELADFLKDRIDKETEKSLIDGVTNSTNLILAQMPPPELSTSNQTFFSGFNSDAVIAQAARTYKDSPSLSRIKSIVGSAAPLVESTLISGMVRGISPRDVAREITQKTGLVATESLRLARTEMINSYRHANLENYRSNSDVVKGWRWDATLDTKMCAMCLAMHGTEHSHDENFETHPNCRCTPTPITASWEELGIFGVADTPTPITNNLEWFNSQTVATQQRILGKQGYGLFREGKLKLPDFVDRYIDPRYGPARQRASITKALANADQGPLFSVRKALKESEGALENAKLSALHKTGKLKLELLSEDGDQMEIGDLIQVSKIIDKAIPGMDIDSVADLMAFPDDSRVSVYLLDKKVVFEGYWHGKNGEYINMIRSLNVGRKKGSGYIKHEVMAVDGFPPRSGVGTRLFHEAVQRYEKAGIEKVVTLADGSKEDILYNGYYTWARLGYDGKMKANAARNLKSLGYDVTEGSSIQEFILANGNKGLKDWKEYGTGFDGEFLVAKNSKSRIILDSYVRERFHPDTYINPSLSAVGKVKARQLQSKIDRISALDTKGVATEAQLKQLTTARKALNTLNRETDELLPRADLKDLVSFSRSTASPFYRVKVSGMSAEDLEMISELEEVLKTTVGTFKIELPIRKYDADDFRALYKGSAFEQYADDIGGAYDPYRNAIAVANNSTRTLNMSTLAHEWAHAIDYNIGKVRKATETGVFDLMLNEAITKESMVPILARYQKNDEYAQYLLRKDEVFARLMEQYTMRRSARYAEWLRREDANIYWTKKEFEELIPYIERNLEQVRQ